MRSKHPEFTDPQDTEIPLWRYMDFVKFVSLLRNQAVFFARADKLGDPFEGSIPRANEPSRLQRWMNRVPVGQPQEWWDQLMREISERARSTRHEYLINCWHMNRHESAAMWNLYGGSGNSIAIQTTYSRLCEVLPDDCYVGAVKYIDYDKDEIPEWNGFTPYLHKRISFAYEQEVRSIRKFRMGTEMPIMQGEYGEWTYVDLGKLIHSVYIAPAAEEWLSELVEDVARRYEYSFPVHRSQIDAEPFY